MDKPKFAQGIFMTQRKSKAGKDYLQLRLKQDDGTYKTLRAFLSEKTDNYGNQMYTIYESDPAPVQKSEDLPF